MYSIYTDQHISNHAAIALSPVGSSCSSPSSQGSPRRSQQRDSLTPTGSPQVPPKSKTLPNSPRTLKGESGKGASLFQRRAQEVDQCAEEYESKQRVRSMLLMEPKDSSAFSTDERVVFERGGDLEGDG